MATLCVATPALAQDADTDAVLQELAEMRAKMDAMSARIETLESELKVARGEAAASAEVATRAEKTATETAAKAGATEIAWKGAPELKAKGGWSFKPRGRLQLDAGITAVPDSTGRSDGFASELRRGRLGVQGTVPGGFGYKFEVDFDGTNVAITDAFLTYQDGDLELQIGQHNNFQGLEELTSSLFTSQLERAAFTDAFGFQRRLGASAIYSSGDFIVEGGVFTDAIPDLPNENWGASGRVVYAPKLGETQLHFGLSGHYDDLGPGSTVRYRQRPAVAFTDERFINTGSFAAGSETGYGAEFGLVNGRFHAAGEAFWQGASRPGALVDPTFFGGYAEIGYFLTAGDTRGYKDGKFDRVKPSRPVGKGGPGAWQVNLRYDRLDLSDGGIVGGAQDGLLASLIWTPTDYTRFMVGYARLLYSDAVYAAAGGDRDYAVDSLGMRAQIDF
ncbi:porin [Parerythrobacter aurantius]|uniref:porin n=1 Tax=Parerythrobacter aurantius TaxID=3127706 RepID=UPI00324D7DDE